MASKRFMDGAVVLQCTVARPGLAPIAGALAVELLAAALQVGQRVMLAASADAALRNASCQHAVLCNVFEM